MDRGDVNRGCVDQGGVDRGGFDRGGVDRRWMMSADRRVEAWRQKSSHASRQELHVIASLPLLEGSVTSFRPNGKVFKA